MPNIRKPRSGSLQFWPRKRSKRVSPRIRTHHQKGEPGLEGFAGYKAGMTHVIATHTAKSKKGLTASIPVTIIECPGMKIASLRLYSKNNQDLVLKKEILLSKDKDLARKVKLPKKDLSKELEKLNPEEYEEVRVLVHTLPSKTGLGKKTPDLVEFSVTGESIQDKLGFVKENIGKELAAEKVFKEGDYVDVKSITKGKGFQGPVKRFGISIRARKSEKAIRNPGSLGPWKGQGHIMWRVAHAGKMGRHQRTEYNKQILGINEADDVKVKGGVPGYGNPKNKVILIKGSVGGPKKQVIVMQKAQRVKKTRPVPTIEKISQEEKQGN